MDQEPAPKNRLFNLLLIGLGFVLVAGVIYLVLTILNSKSTAYLSTPFAQNITNPYKMDAEQLYFTTGNGFASLNTGTNQTKQLGVTRLLPKNPTAVQWTKNGAAIQASSYTIFDELGTMVQSQTQGGRDKPTFAWYVPYQGNPVVLDKNTSSLYADSNTGLIYYLWKIHPMADGALLRTFSSVDGSRQQFMAAGISEPFRIVYTSGDYVWAVVGYGDEVSLVKYGRTGEPTVLAENIFNSSGATVGSPVVMISESYFVAVQQEGNKSVLFSYDLNKQKRQVIDADFSGSINRGSGASVYATSTRDGQAIVRRITAANKITKLSVSMPEGVLTNGFDWGDDHLVTNLINQVQLVSTNKSATENLPAIKSGGLDKAINPAHQNVLYSLTIELDNAANNNSYNVNIYPPYAQNTAVLFEDIKAAGYDPNQLELILNQTVIRQ